MQVQGRKVFVQLDEGARHRQGARHPSDERLPRAGAPRRFDTEFARNLPSREEVSPDRMTACRGAG